MDKTEALGGLPDLEAPMPLPQEWVPLGKRKTATGRVVIVFSRPNEPDIGLFEDRLTFKDGRWSAPKWHVDYQADWVKKGGKK